MPGNFLDFTPPFSFSPKFQYISRRGKSVFIDIEGGFKGDPQIHEANPGHTSPSCWLWCDDKDSEQKHEEAVRRKLYPEHGQKYES
ncbi:hypothetical protein Ddc_18143 [Ditylenchus destructor]|nr:hypothetical protein Ddc_18143 [Ditylenchus destructor]